MFSTKQVVKSIISSGFEAVKDSAKQVGKTVSPTALIEQATGGQKNEFSEYLKQVGDPNLTGDNLKNREKELRQKDEEETAKLRTYLQATPAHMRLPQKPAPPRAYEAAIQEKEQQQRLAEQQKEQPVSLGEPAGKVRGKPGQKRRPKTADFEKGKNVKIG